MASCFGSRLVQPDGLRTLDHGHATALMELPKLLVDGRNVLDPGEVRAAGSRYRGFGQV
jgi:UDPglucose 6-dehydrogenase